MPDSPFPRWYFLPFLLALLIVLSGCGSFLPAPAAKTPPPSTSTAAVQATATTAPPTVTATPAAATTTPEPTTIAGAAASVTRLMPGMYVGYDQRRQVGNDTAEARGSHFFLPWREIEDGQQGQYDWQELDGWLDSLEPGKKAIVRLVTRCQDVNNRDACAPAWTLLHYPIMVENAIMTERMNYLDPTVKKGLLELIQALGDRYKNDDRIVAFEIGVGYGGEPIPYPATKNVPDREEQAQAYEASYSEEDWAQYHKDVIDAYVEAFSGAVDLITITNATYAEDFRADVVKHAVDRGVGLLATNLRADFNSNRGSEDDTCWWGFSTVPGFSNESELAPEAYHTHFVPLSTNSQNVIVGYEYKGRSDSTGYIPVEDETFTRWGMLNGLDKGAKYVLPFNDGAGQPSQVQYTDVWAFFNRYAGRTAATTPDVWIAFRSPRKWEKTWCPDIYDYSWHLISELETLPYADAASQAVANEIDAQTGVFKLGDEVDWRGTYARTTADSWPVFNLDIDDAFLYDGRFDVDVVVTYFDHRAGGAWSLIYDRVDGEQTAGIVNLEGTNQWRERVFHLKDARFANRLRPYHDQSRAAGFDLRLDRHDTINDIFHMVRIIPSPATPTPTATFTPTPVTTSRRFQMDVNGYAGVQDTYMSQEEAEKRFDTEPILLIQQDNTFAALVRFDLESLPPDTVIRSASLGINRKDDHESILRLSIYKLLRQWSNAATYEMAAPGQPWSLPGALGLTDASFSPIPPASLPIPPHAALQFNFTDTVRDWVTNPTRNYGVILRSDGDGDDYGLTSSEYRTIGLRPYLDIVYEVDTSAPTPTTTPVPTDTPTLTPTLIPTIPTTATKAPTPTVTPTSTPFPTATRTNTPPPTKTPSSPSPTPTATAPAAACAPRHLTSVTVGTHPKGVIAGPEGAQVGLYDSAELALVSGDEASAFISTNGRGANAVAYWQGIAYMVHRDSNTVSVIDLADSRQIGALAVGGMPWGAAAAAGRLYVTSFAENAINVFALADHKSIATVPVTSQPALVAAGNDRAFITHLNGYVSVVNADGTLLDTFGPVTGDDAFGIALDEMRNRLYVGSRNAKSILVLDSRTGEEVDRYQLSVQPYALAFNAATKQLLAVDAVNNRLLAIDTRSGEQISAQFIAVQSADHGGQGLAVWDNVIYVAAYDAGVLDIFDGGRCAVATPTPTAIPGQTATTTVAPSPTPSTTPVPTWTPTATATKTPTRVPTATPTPRPSSTPTPRPTVTPTVTPSPTPSSSPSPTATSTPQPSIIAKIEIVWPHGNAPVSEAKLANITAHLYEDELLNPVACDFDQPVRLWTALNNAPARQVAVGEPRRANQNGRVFTVWDFNDIDVSTANDPQNVLNFFVTVDGYATRRNIWTHGADARTQAPQQDIPDDVTQNLPPALDAKIEIVWPHDNAPITEAQLANISAILFEQNTLKALGGGVQPRPRVRLYSSVNNGINHERQQAPQGQPRVIRGKHFDYLAWDFNDIDVSPANNPDNRIYFWLEVEDVTGATNIWTHGASGLTIAPEQDVPAHSCR